VKLPAFLGPASGVALVLASVLAACSDAQRSDDRASEEELQAPAVPDDPDGGGGTPDPTDVDPGGPWTPTVETGTVTFPYIAYKCGYAIRSVSPSQPEAKFHDGAAGAAPAPKNLHVTIAGNAATSVAISWATDATTMQTEVRFGDSPTRLDKVAHGFSFATGAGDRRQHEVHLCGLKSGSTFYYDAGGAAGRSAVHKVTTAPGDASEVTLLVVGDTRSAPSVLGGFAAKAMAQGPTAMLLSGDAVATGGSQPLWDELFDAAPDLFAEVPGLWAHGNHEGLDELYFQQLALPDHQGGTTQIEQWYATTYGPLRVVVLNDTVSSSAQITGSERQFLEASLRAVDRARTPFVTTIHHQPMYTTSNGHASNTQLRSAWGPLLATYKVNTDIAGHVHSYESTTPIVAGTTNTTTDAAGGTRFFNFGGGGAGLYGFTTTQPWIKTRESTNGFAILKVNVRSMTWTAFRKDGSVIETMTIAR
jgi:hypothetical protein